MESVMKEQMGVIPHNFWARTAPGTRLLARYCYRMSSVCMSVTLMYRGNIGWTRSKVITRIISV